MADRPLHGTRRAARAGRRSRCSRTTSSTSSADCRRCARSTAARRRSADRAVSDGVPAGDDGHAARRRFSPAPCSSSPPRSASRSSPSPSACAWSTAGIGFEAGLTVSCSRPSCTCRCGTSLRSTTRAPTASPSPSGCSISVEAPLGGRARKAATAPSPRDAAVRLEGVSYSLSRAAGCGAAGRRPRAAPGRDGRARRSERRRKEHGRRAAARGSTEPTRGRVCVGDVDLVVMRSRVVAATGRLGPAVADALPRDGCATTSGSARRRADDDEVRAAAGWRAPTFVRDLPDGYETVVGRRRQAAFGRPAPARRARARLLRDAPFVILDEPTANLDPVNARARGRGDRAARATAARCCSSSTGRARGARPTGSCGSTRAGSSTPRRRSSCRRWAHDRVRRLLRLADAPRAGSCRPCSSVRSRSSSASA